MTIQRYQINFILVGIQFDFQKIGVIIPGGHKLLVRLYPIGMIKASLIIVLL